ncbi:MAG: MGMT family protein [Nitrososphaerales archaeon]
MADLRITREVLRLTSQIPRGKVSTYGLIATALGNRNLSRLVGQSLKSNPTPIRIPCHRVVNSDRRLGGYKGLSPSDEKESLLMAEGVEVDRTYRIPKSIWKEVVFNSFSR